MNSTDDQSRTKYSPRKKMDLSIQSMRVALEEREETDTEIDWQSLRTLFTDVSDAWEAVKKQGPLYVTQTVEIVYPPGASPQANSSTRSSREPPGRPSQEGSSGYSQLDKAAVLAKLFESGMISPRSPVSHSERQVELIKITLTLPAASKPRLSTLLGRPVWLDLAHLLPEAIQVLRSSLRRERAF